MPANDRFDRNAQLDAHRFEPADRVETAFRHSGWQNRRRQVLTALESIGISEINRDHFMNCGAACMVEWSPSLQKHRLRASYCHNRHCEPCQRAKANLIAANLRSRLSREADGRYRFLTLTLRHDGTPLVDRVKRLNGCWRKLRECKLWKTTQKGGCAILEVKLSEHLHESGRPNWHTHLHVIAEGGWMNQSALADAWLKITGDSHQVDIRALDRAEDCAAYVVKYVTKGTSPTVWADRSLAQEWLIASKGVRTCATYGSWRGHQLLKRPAKATDWQPVGRLTTLIQNARMGDESAARLLIVLRRPDEDWIDLITPQ